MDDPYPSYHLIAQIAELTPSYLIFNGLLFVLLLLGSALVSGSEVAFFSLTNDDLFQLNEEDSKESQKVLKLVESPQELT